MSSDANKQNSETPSPSISFENQLVYRVASLEATVVNSLRRLDEKMDRMQSELHDRHVEVANQLAFKRARMDAFEKEINQMKYQHEKEMVAAKEHVRVQCEELNDRLCARVDAVEKWQTKATIRASMAFTGVVGLWVVFGRVAQDWLVTTF